MSAWEYSRCGYHTKNMESDCEICQCLIKSDAEIAKLKEEIKRLESWVTAAGEFILGQTYLMNDDEKLIVTKFANKIIETAK